MDEVYGSEGHDPHRRQRTQRFAPGGQPEAASKSARGVATRRELPNCGDRMAPGTQLSSVGVIVTHAHLVLTWQAERLQSAGANNSPKKAGDGTPKFCSEQDGAKNSTMLIDQPDSIVIQCAA